MRKTSVERKRKGSENSKTRSTERRRSILETMAESKPPTLDGETKNLLIVLEHYKLDLSMILPQICEQVSGVKKRNLAESKKVKKLKKVQKRVRKIINQIRETTINDHGAAYDCTDVKDFEQKVRQFKLINKQVENLDTNIKEAINKAIDGMNPDLKVDKDDPKLDTETYQAIVSKIYATIRFKVY